MTQVGSISGADGTAVLEDAAGAAVEALRSAVAGLLAVELTGLSGIQVTSLLAGVERERRRLAGVDHRLVAEVEARGVAGAYGATSTAHLLSTLLRVSPAEARARVVHAGELGPRHTLTGDALAPVLPLVADAVNDGTLSADHVSVISRTLEQLPPDLHPAVFDVAERFLVDAARTEHPAALARTAEHALQRLDPDGREPREHDRERRRSFTLHTRPDGTAHARGELTAEATAIWNTILDTLAAPTPATDTGGTDASGTDPSDTTATESGTGAGVVVPDLRSATQRRHDALLDAGTRILRSDTLPWAGGTPVTVLLHATTSTTPAAAASANSAPPNSARPNSAPPNSAPPNSAPPNSAPPNSAPPDSAPLDVLPPEQSPGHFATITTAHGAVLSPRQLLPLTCDAALIPILFGPDGAVLHLGRTQRLANRPQRLAAAARDRGCVFPGCTRPPAWCELHHITDWVGGGPTDINNLCLLCRHHHRTFATAGWQIRMDTHGTPEAVPPGWYDPNQEPIRNTAHHRDNIFPYTPVGMERSEGYDSRSQLRTADVETTGAEA